MGPETVLMAEEEARLEKWIIDKAKVGFPMHPDVVKDAVQNVLNDAKRDSPFVDNRPGKKWMSLFLKRKPEIVKRNTEIISKARAAVTEEKIRSWFAEVVSFTEEEGVGDVLKDGSRIFNCDEIGMHTCPKTGIVLGPKGFKNLYEIANGPEKESITVLCTYSANGKVPPPMVVFPYKRIPGYIADALPDGWAIGRSDSGWMVFSTFYEYVANVFYPWLLEMNVQFPVILFLDGHKSHLSLELCTFCIEKQIIVYCLPPNSTHIMQPCDVSMFRPQKECWKKIVRSRKQESVKAITKANFAPFFKIAFDKSAKLETIVNGFRACGLFPFNPDAIDYSKCISERHKSIQNTTASSVMPTSEEYAITRRVIEHIIGPNKTNNFIKLHQESNDCEDSLFQVWKLCMELCAGEKGNELELTSAITEQIPGIENWATLNETQELDIPIEFIGDDVDINALTGIANEIFESPSCSNIETPILAIKQRETATESTAEQIDTVQRKEPPLLQSAGENNVEIEAGQRNNVTPKTVAEKDETGTIQRKLPIVVSDVVVVAASNNISGNSAHDIWNAHLHWPNIGEGKRDKLKVPTEKPPFAITSKKWKEIKARRKSTLIEKQRNAAEKRNMREEKKKDKEKAAKVIKIKKEPREKVLPARNKSRSTPSYQDDRLGENIR